MGALPAHCKRCHVINVHWLEGIFFAFLTLKVLMSVLGRTQESKSSIHVQHGCIQKLSGIEAHEACWLNMW